MGLQARCELVGVQYPLVDGEGDTVPALDIRAPLVAVGLDGEAGRPAEVHKLAPAALAHHQHVGLAPFHGVHELVQLREREGGAGGTHGDDLVAGRLGGDVHDKAVEHVGVVGLAGKIGRRGTVDESSLPLMAHRLGGQLQDHGLDVLDIGPRLLDEVVQVGVPAQDGQGGRELVELRCGGSRPVSQRGMPGGGSQGLLPVIGQAVALDVHEGHDLEYGALRNDGLNDSPEKDVLSCLCRFG